MSGPNFHAQQELEAERYTKNLLLLDKVARGEGTIEVACELARRMGIEYTPLRKRAPIMEGTCNEF